MAAQARGTDLATLSVALPALGLGLWRARSGSAGAQLIVLGMLGYLLYAYGIFAFQVVVNPATPAYLAILGLAAWSLGLRLPVLGTSAQAGIGAPLSRRVTGGFLGFIVLAFGGLWTAEIIGAITSGLLPASVRALGLPTSAVYALDIAFLLPVMAIDAVLLVRRATLGPSLAIALLAFTVTMVLSILGLMALQAQAGIAVDPVVAIVFSVVGLVALGLLVGGLRPATPAPIAARAVPGGGRGAVSIDASAAGVGLILGAGVGYVLGAVLADPSAGAISAAIGAGLGLVIGSVVGSSRLRQRTRPS